MAVGPNPESQSPTPTNQPDEVRDLNSGLPDSGSNGTTGHDGPASGDLDRPGSQPTGAADDGGSDLSGSSQGVGSPDNSGGIQPVGRTDETGTGVEGLGKDNVTVPAQAGESLSADKEPGLDEPSTGDVPEKNGQESANKSDSDETTPESETGTPESKGPMTREQKLRFKATIKLAALRLASVARQRAAENATGEALEDRRKDSK
ncbi:hypothetical protein [Siphonobacter sp. SORGH_AS_1065]|uniref:hypothetical protein n=1 Tax=Siphonobacter sp. SORGH_AS_1065 TaxID=3041795 RepID=UPI00278087A2|nr:hypothetical protein [Siphonobacter sp. SORGH_AS_1065]MDQ1089000.1 hypothetical protein [Siphonobacter sp. SORGH_AS_1065]